MLLHVFITKETGMLVVTNDADTADDALVEVHVLKKARGPISETDIANQVLVLDFSALPVLSA
jgi:hypothetical protein